MQNEREREEKRKRVFPSQPQKLIRSHAAGTDYPSGRKRFTHSCYSVTIVLYLICGDRTGLTDALQARQSE